MNQDKETLEKLIHAVSEETAAVSYANREYLEAVFDLKTKTAQLWVHGVEGKNATERESSVELTLHKEYLNVHKAKMDLEKQKNYLKLAELQYEQFKLLLEISEK